jgi:hypothetical protein
MMKMKTRIYTLVVALLMIAAGATAQSKTATTISVAVANADNMVDGDDANVVITMTPDDFNGIATISVTPEGGDSKPYNVAVVNGVGSYVVQNLASAAYEITASYAGDEQYEASTSDAKTLTVNKIPTALSLALKDTEINVGECTAFGIRLLNTNDEPQILRINAIVTFKVNGANRTVGLVNGEDGYSINLESNKTEIDMNYKDSQNALCNLAAGTYKIKAYFAGDDVYLNSESEELTLTVNKIAVDGLSVADMSAINAGEDAIVNVTMTPTNINAAAKLVVGTEEYPFAIVGGSGKCLVPNVKAGTYNVKAVLDDYKYSGESTAKQLTVNGTDPLFKEKNAKVTVKLDTESDGFVTLTVDGNDYYVAVKNGEGTFIAPQMTAGSNNIKAALAADDQYVGTTVDKAATIQCVPGISYNFAEGQEWMTWCDEWGWAKPDGIKAYTISGVSDDAISIEEITDGIIPSHTPLLLQKTGDALTPTSVKAAAGTDDLVSAAGSGFTFWGNTTNEVINAGNYYTAGKSYVLYKGTFLKANADNGIAANRCLLTLSSPNATRSLSIGDGTTSLREVNSGEVNSEEWYSLDGRKLGGKPTKKGVYIRNGKKEVVR